MNARASLFKIVTDIVGLLQVKENEKAVVLTPHRYNEQYAETFMAALDYYGADLLRIILPPKKRGGRLVDPGSASDYAVETLKNADIVINIPFETIPFPVPMTISMYSEEFNDILRAGARWLDVMVRPELNLHRLFPTEATIKRSFAGAEMMDKAETIKVTSDAGTNIKLSKKGRRGGCQAAGAGCTKPGAWENYGFALVSCSPLEDSANGTLVINTNDHILHLRNHPYVTEPIKCTLKDGRIVKIEGEYTAKLLERWLAQAPDEMAFYTSHIGWGTHVEGAVWAESPYFIGADAESYPGVMQIAFGNNSMSSPVKRCGLGGKNTSKSHLDIELLNCNFYLDDELIVKKGKIIHQKCV